MNLVPNTSITLLRELVNQETSPRWQEFVKQYHPMLIAFLKKYFPFLDADDLIQETFITVAKILPNYHYAPNEKGYFHNFLTGILYHKALNAVRKQHRRQAIDQKYANEVDYRETPDETIEEDWKKAIYEIALQQFLQDENISDRNKQILIRTAIKGEKPEIIAHSLGVSRNVVDQTKKRMLDKLRKLVQDLKNGDTI